MDTKLNDKPQSDKFKELARELEVGEAHCDEWLKKVAKGKPPDEKRQP